MKNDEIIAKVKKRKILKVFIIIFACLTVISSVLALLNRINVIYALIFLLIETVLTKYRDTLNPKK